MDPVRPIRGETLPSGPRQMALATCLFWIWLALLGAVFFLTQIPITVSRFEGKFPLRVVDMRAAVLSYLTAPTALH